MSDKTANLHIDKYLTNVSLQYNNTMFIGEQVLGTVPVAKQSDVIAKYDKESYNIPKDFRANGALSNRVKSYGVGTTNYFAPVFSYDDIVTDQDKSNADSPIQPFVDTTEGLKQKSLLKKEKRAADALFNTTTFTSQTSALTGTDRWSDLTNSDPIGNAETARETVRAAIGRYPNTCTIGAAVWTKLKQHPDILERIKYTQKGIITTDLVAALFGVDKLLVGGAIYNTAIEGQTASLSDVWGKFALFSWVSPTAKLREPSVGYALHWKIAGGKIAKVVKYRDNPHGGEVVEYEWSYQHKVLSAESGYLYSTVVA